MFPLKWVVWLGVGERHGVLSCVCGGGGIDIMYIVLLPRNDILGECRSCCTRWGLVVWFKLATLYVVLFY